MYPSTPNISQHLYEGRNCSGFEKNIAFSCLKCFIIGIYRKQKEESVHAKTATVPSGFVMYLVDKFCPQGEDVEPILLTLDEYKGSFGWLTWSSRPHEAVCRAVDIPPCRREDLRARRKIAACLVHGKPLHIGETTASAEDETAHCGRCCGCKKEANIEKSGQKLQRILL